jgi:hypothetical protein
MAAETSPSDAQDFLRGFEMGRRVSTDSSKLLQDYFSEIESLTGFLIERQGQYRITQGGLLFYRDEDLQLFNERVLKINRLTEQGKSADQKARELREQILDPR